MRKYINAHKWAIITLAAGFLFIVIGIYREEAATVFTKAAAVCLECIGIG